MMAKRIALESVLLQLVNCRKTSRKIKPRCIFRHLLLSYTRKCPRRDAGVAELARLESVCARKGTVGSNPTLSATTETQFLAPAVWNSAKVQAGTVRDH